MPTATRESDRYWHNRPADHSARGFFMLGPQEPVQPLTRLAQLVKSRCRETPEGPRGARQRMKRQRRERLTQLERNMAFVRAVTGRPFRP